MGPVPARWSPPSRAIRPYERRWSEGEIHTNANKEIGMDTPARYFDLWFIHISYPNLIVIGVMIVLFAVALVAPFPHGSDSDA